MNFKNLENDFSVRFNTKTKPYFTFSGTPLYILGDLTFPDSGHSLITALSSGTALAICLEGEDYSIQETQNNIIYSCDKKKLLSYNEKNYATPLFHAVHHLNSYFKKEPKGIKLLFEHNTISKGFHNYMSPLITAYLKLYPDSSPENVLTALSPIKFTKKEYFSLLSTTSLKKGHINLTDNLTLLSKDYSLPLSNAKIIIIKTNIKPKRIYTDFSPISDPDDLPREQRKILTFFVKEEKRIMTYPEITTSADFHNLINDSCEDLLSLIDLQPITLLVELANKTSMLSLRPIVNSSSIYATVPDEDVDDFVKFVGNEYEKKAGAKPTFYITDTVDSGVMAKSHVKAE